MGSCIRKANNQAVYIQGQLTNAFDNESFYQQHEDMQPYRKDFDRLMLNGYHLSLLFKAFVKIDQDLSGEISTWELLEFLHLERTKFTKRIFRIFDEDGSGQIDFREFCMSLWNYATLGKNQLIMFAFDLYDNDGSGQIDRREFHRAMRLMNRKQNLNLSDGEIALLFKDGAHTPPQTRCCSRTASTLHS